MKILYCGTKNPQLRVPQEQDITVNADLYGLQEAFGSLLIYNSGGKWVIFSILFRHQNSS